MAPSILGLASAILGIPTITTFIQNLISALTRNSEYIENVQCTRNQLQEFEDEDLLDKMSILLTPTAYSDGSLNTVIPPYQVFEERVVNGDFSDGTNNWVGNVNTTLSVSNGQLDIQSVGGIGGVYGVAFTEVNFVEGKKYLIKLDVISTDRPTHIRVGTSNAVITSSPTNIYGSGDIGIGSHEKIFTATATDTYLSIGGRDDMTTLVVDNVSVREVTVADFDFSRGSSATRVNEQGLVEDVQILSGELVQNGNFEQIGSELVTNGNFATDIDWNLSNAVIENGVGKFQESVGTFSRIRQNINFIGQTKVTYTISFNNSSNTTIQLRSYGGGNSELIPAVVGTHTVYRNFTSDGVSFQTGGLAAGEEIHLDNVSVKEVGQNWSFGTGWSMGDGKAIRTGTDSTALSQSFSALQNKKFRLSFEVLDWTVGHLKGYFYGGGGSDEFFDNTSIGNGSFTFEVTTTINRTNFAFLAFGSFDGSIDNVSIKEVTDDTDLPRIDYSPYSGSGTCGHLLLEPQRTNSLPYSEDFTTYSDFDLSIESNTQETLSPQGVYNATKFTATGTDPYVFKSGINVTANTQTASIYVKGVGNSIGKDGRILFWYIGTAGGSSSSIPFTLTSNWQRVEGSSTPTSSGTLAIRVDLPNTAEVGDESYVYGFQMEEGSYATSYIPTSGSTVTRSAEVANNSGNADLFNDSEGVLYAEIAALDDDLSNRFISLTDGTDNNSVTIYYGGVSNRIRSEIKSGAVTQADLSTTAYSIINYNKIAVKYKQNSFSLYVNGTEVATDTSGSTPSGLNDLSFDRANILTFFGKTKCVAVFKEALSNNDLELLTGEGYNSFAALATAFNYNVI